MNPPGAEPPATILSTRIARPDLTGFPVSEASNADSIGRVSFQKLQYWDRQKGAVII